MHDENKVGSGVDSEQDATLPPVDCGSQISTAAVKTTEACGGFQPLPFVFRDLGNGLALTEQNEILAYKRVELEVDLTEPLHNLLDDLLPYSPTDLEDVILLMCGRKQLSLSTTFQDFTFPGINGTRAKVKLDLLWNSSSPSAEPMKTDVGSSTRANGKISSQTIINIEDLYRIVDEGDPLYWLNTVNGSGFGSSSGRSTSSATLLSKQYSHAIRTHDDAAEASGNSHTADDAVPPLSPPGSGAHLLSPLHERLSAEEGALMMLDETERDDQQQSDVVQQRDLVVSVATGNGSVDDTSTTALTPSSGGAGSVGGGGRRSRGSHRSGASFCGSHHSAGNTFSTSDKLAAPVVSSSMQSVTNEVLLSNTVLGSEVNIRKRRRKQSLAATSRTDQQQSTAITDLNPVSVKSEPVAMAALETADDCTKSVPRRTPSKRVRRTVRATSKSASSGMSVDATTTHHPELPLVRVKSASPSADYLMSVSRMLLNGDNGENDLHSNQLFQFLPGSPHNNVVVEPRDVHTSSTDYSTKLDGSSLAADQVRPSVVGVVKPAAKRRRSRKKPANNNKVNVAANESNDIKPAESELILSDIVVDTDPNNNTTGLPLVIKKKRTIGANSYYAYTLGQTFDAVGKNIQLWQYLLELLMDPPRHQRSMEWLDGNGTFTLKEPERVAFLWGERKGSKKRKSESMSYENMSRALRYYYGEILDKVPSKQFTYRFINLKERIGHQPSEMFSYARTRAEAAGLQLPSSSTSSPSSQPQKVEPSSPHFSSNGQQLLVAAAVADNALALETQKTHATSRQSSTPRLKSSSRQNSQPLPASDESASTKRARTNKKAKLSKQPKCEEPSDDNKLHADDAGNINHQQNHLNMGAIYESKPVDQDTSHHLSPPRQNSACHSGLPATHSNTHFSHSCSPTTNAASSLFPPNNSSSIVSTMLAAMHANDHANTSQLQPSVMPPPQRSSPADPAAAVLSGVHNNNNNNPMMPQNLSMLFQQLAASSAGAAQNCSISNNNNNFTLLNNNKANHFNATSPTPSASMVLDGPNTMQPSQFNAGKQVPAQLLAQLFQHQQQQQFLQQQQRQQQQNSMLTNNSNNSGVANCITLPGIGTINLASLVAPQQTVPNNNHNNMNATLMAALLTASGGLNIADGLRNLVAKVAENGSQVNQLMAAVGLATLLSSAQQQQQQQQQAPPVPAPVNNNNNVGNVAAQLFALLQQQQQQQQASASVPSSGASSTCAAPFGMFGMRF